MVRLIQNTWFFVRLAWPGVWGVFTATLWAVILTVASIGSGIPSAVRTISEEWLQRAIRAGFPTIWESQLRFVLRSLVILTMLFGWIVLSFTTVLIVEAIL
ncbi:MAG: hypothetical protein L0Y56_18345 [Nitrospira sp.]|nr:hypothetical protein [Nitrospira sp.]